MNPGTFSSLLRHEPDWNSWIIMRQQFWHTCTLATSTVAKTQRQNKCHHHHVSAVEAMCNTHMHAHMHTHTNTRRKIYIKNLPAYLLKVAHVVTETQDFKQPQKKEKKPPVQPTKPTYSGNSHSKKLEHSRHECSIKKQNCKKSQYSLPVSHVDCTKVYQDFSE